MQTNIQQLHMLTKKKMHLPTILPHNTACWLFFSCPLSKKVSIHINFSAFWVLLFTTRLVPARSCQGSWYQAEQRRISQQRSLLGDRGSAERAARPQARARGRRQQLKEERAGPMWGCTTGSEDLECFCLISLCPQCKIAGSPAQSELKQELKPFLCQYF